MEAVGRGAGSYHYCRALTVPAVDGLQKVGLLGLGRQTSGRTATLYIDNNQRQLSHHCQTDGFAFERQTGTGGGGGGQITGERGTDSRTYTRYLVLCLNNHHTHIFPSCQLLHDVGGGSDRIRAEEQALARFLGSSYQTPCSGFVARNRGVSAVRQIVSLLDINSRDTQMKVVAVIETVGQYLHIRSYELRLLLELTLKKLYSFVYRTVEQPAYYT